MPKRALGRGAGPWNSYALSGERLLYSWLILSLGGLLATRSFAQSLDYGSISLGVAI